jgi:hypothetical protein
MTDKTLVLGMFDNEAAADTAAAGLKESGAADGDAIGVLALDGNGVLKESKVGARSIGKGAGIGAALFLLGPGAVGVGLVAGGAAGALHHKGLQLDGTDRARITSDLQNGRAAVGVLARGIDVAPITAKLTELGGTSESHDVSDEAALTAEPVEGPTA